MRLEIVWLEKAVREDERRVRTEKKKKHTNVLDPVCSVPLKPKHTVVRIIKYLLRALLRCSRLLPHVLVGHPVEPLPRRLISGSNGSWGILERIRIHAFDDGVLGNDAGYKRITWGVLSRCASASGRVDDERESLVEKAVGYVEVG